MNAFIHETCKALGGEDGKNPAAHYIKSVGMQHLNGIQAVAYGRLRLMDSDYRRTERQKEILAQCLEKAKQKNVNELTAIAEYILPQVAYNFDFTELISIIRIATKIKLTETGSIPKLDNIKQTHMGPSNDCVVPLNLEKAVKELHKSLFETEDYTPTSKVHSYSVRITELRRQFEAENDQRKAAKAMEEALESQALEAGITNTQIIQMQILIHQITLQIIQTLAIQQIIIQLTTTLQIILQTTILQIILEQVLKQFREHRALVAQVITVMLILQILQTKHMQMSLREM